MRRSFVFLTLLSLFCFTQVARAKDPLESTTWTIKVTPDDDSRSAGARGFDDTVIFKGGKFSSDNFKGRGFDPADYEGDTRRISAVAQFTVNAKSDKQGTAKWTGTVDGNQISGQLVWTQADGSVVNFTFTGDKKA